MSHMDFQVRCKFTCGTRLPEDSCKGSCEELAAADAVSGKLGLKCKSVAFIFEAQPKIFPCPGT